jgi:hypothetical protein
MMILLVLAAFTALLLSGPDETPADWDAAGWRIYRNRMDLQSRGRREG